MCLLHEIIKFSSQVVLIILIINFFGCLAHSQGGLHLLLCLGGLREKGGREKGGREKGGREKGKREGQEREGEEREGQERRAGERRRGERREGMRAGCMDKFKGREVPSIFVFQ